MSIGTETMARLYAQQGHPQKAEIKVTTENGSYTATTTISVYEDKIYIWNDGTMPDNLSSTEKLFEKHSSKPFNPRLAGIFFKSGMIEAWGRGFDKIKDACEKYNNAPLPEFWDGKRKIHGRRYYNRSRNH